MFWYEVNKKVTNLDRNKISDLDPTMSSDLDRSRSADLDPTKSSNLDRTRSSDPDPTKSSDLDRTRSWVKPPEKIMKLQSKNLMEKMDKDSQYNSASSLHDMLLVGLQGDA